MYRNGRGIGRRTIALSIVQASVSLISNNAVLTGFLTEKFLNARGPALDSTPHTCNFRLKLRREFHITLYPGCGKKKEEERITENENIYSEYGYSPPPFFLIPGFPTLLLTAKKET